MPMTTAQQLSYFGRYMRSPIARGHDEKCRRRPRSNRAFSRHRRAGTRQMPLSREALLQGVLATARCEKQRNLPVVLVFQYLDQVERYELIHSGLEAQVCGSERALDRVLGHRLPVGLRNAFEHVAFKCGDADCV